MKNAEPQQSLEIMKTAKINSMCQTGHSLCANLHTPLVEGESGRSQGERGGFKLASDRVQPSRLCRGNQKKHNSVATIVLFLCASVCACLTFLWTIDLSCCCCCAPEASPFIVSAPTECLASANVESRRRNFQAGGRVGGFGEWIKFGDESSTVELENKTTANDRGEFLDNTIWQIILMLVKEKKKSSITSFR